MSVKHLLTYDDYAALPEDGKRYELLAGELYVTPSATPLHQLVAKRLARQLETFFEHNGPGVIFCPAADMILSRHDVFVPDIVVVLEASQISQRAIEGPGSLVVEVLSPSNRAYDRGRKQRRYRELGVEHYWVVDPDARRLLCLRAEGSDYLVSAEGQGHDRVTDPAWPNLVVDLAPLWH